MLSSTVRTQILRRVATRLMSSEAAAATTVKFNFALPHETLYEDASVASVIIPGIEGEYGVGAGHMPYVAQLKPGVLQILHEEGTSESEKYFVAGGLAMTHPDSSTYVVCPEAVKLDDLDLTAITSNYEKAKSAFGSAAAGSVEQAEAQIEMETNKAMALALGTMLG